MHFMVKDLPGTLVESCECAEIEGTDPVVVWAEVAVCVLSEGAAEDELGSLLVPVG